MPQPASWRVNKSGMLAGGVRATSVQVAPPSVVCLKNTPGATPWQSFWGVTFPLMLPVSADAAFAGPVTITIDGLGWDTQALLATGSTAAQVVAGHETQASLTLTATSAAVGGDGGAPDGADGGD